VATHEEFVATLGETDDEFVFDTSSLPEQIPVQPPRELQRTIYSEVMGQLLALLHYAHAKRPDDLWTAIKIAARAERIVAAYVAAGSTSLSNSASN
jgi:hypothetical protein